MAVTFYPHEDELSSSTMDQKLEVLLEAARRYKAVILDPTTLSAAPAEVLKRNMTPRQIGHAYNWEQIAALLREIRELPEANQNHKLFKAEKLKKLAEIYEVLRGAKMSKLEAVRIALINEATQLQAGVQVA